MKPRARYARDLLPVAVAMGIVLTTRSSLADHYHVPSGSMRPTLQAGDHIAVDKRAYGLRLPLTALTWTTQSPERGDVVVFPSPQSGTTLVKRVVAIGGDVVEIRSGGVKIDGHISKRETSHGVRLTEGGGPDFGPVRVPADHVLVLGDNRGNSHDGRFFGFVPNSKLLGRVVGVFLRDDHFTWQEPH